MIEEKFYIVCVDEYKTLINKAIFLILNGAKYHAFSVQISRLIPIDQTFRSGQLRKTDITEGKGGAFTWAISARGASLFAGFFFI